METVSLAGGLAMDLFLAPDGKTLFAGSTGEGAKVDVETRSKTGSYPVTNGISGLDLSPDGRFLGAVTNPRPTPFRRSPWRSSGFPIPTTYTLQGVIEDLGSISPSKLGLTNSVTRIVE